MIRSLGGGGAVGTPGNRSEFENLSKFEFIFETALEYETEAELGDVFLWKTAHQKSQVNVFLNL
jgi:hypothetical protein